jgi:hypothetical protein
LCFYTQSTVVGILFYPLLLEFFHKNVAHLVFGIIFHTFQTCPSRRSGLLHYTAFFRKLPHHFFYILPHWRLFTGVYFIQIIRIEHTNIDQMKKQLFVPTLKSCISQR